MPLFRTGRQIVYFAHILRCAGTTVEEYLEKRFGPLSFVDRDWWHRPHWTRSSPQHAPVGEIERLFAPGLLDASFAVVRHHALRIVSAFRHNRVRDRMWPLKRFDHFLGELEAGRWILDGRADNHFRPMIDFVPETAAIFRLEEGWDGLTRWLDSLQGDKSPRIAFGHANRTPAGHTPSRGPLWHALKQALQAPFPPLTDAQFLRLYKLYRPDYELFGYAVRPESHVVQSASLLAA